MKKLILALAVSTAASQASAVWVQELSLVSINTYNSAKDSTSFFTMESGTDATFEFDGTTLTSSGDLDMSIYIPTILYTIQMTDAVFQMDGSATSASSFECVEGLFGGYVGANICANTTLNGGTATLEYNIGGDATQSSRTLTGGATAEGDHQQIQDWNVDASSVIWDGANLEFDTVLMGTSNVHLVFTGWGCEDDYNTCYWRPDPVSEVPIPAAAWLFGSALLGLAGIKRRK